MNNRLYFVVALFCVLSGQLAAIWGQERPILEISFGDREALSVTVDESADAQKAIAAIGQKPKQGEVAVSLIWKFMQSDDGNRIVIQHGIQNPETKFFDAERTLRPFWSKAGKCQLSPVGKEVLLSDQDGWNIELVDSKGRETPLFNNTNRKSRNKAKPNSKRSPFATFSPSGDLLLIGDNNEQRNDRFNFLSREDGLPVFRSAFNADESVLATSHWVAHGLIFGRVVHVDLDSGKIIGDRTVRDDHVLSGQFSKNKNHAIINMVHKNQLVNLRTWKTMADFPGGGPAFFSNNQDTVSIAGEEGNFSKFKFDGSVKEKSPNKLNTFRTSLKYDMFAANNQHIGQDIQIDPVNRLIFRLGGHGRNSGQNAILNTETGATVGRLVDNARAVDGAKKLIYAQKLSSTVIQVFDFENDLVRELRMPAGQIVAISPNGKQFVYRQETRKNPETGFRTDAKLVVYDSITGKQKRVLGWFDTRLSVQFSPKGSQLILRPSYSLVVDKVENEGSVFLVDFETGTTLNQFDFDPWFCSHVEFSEDEKQILLCFAINTGFWARSGKWRDSSFPKLNPKHVAEFEELTKDWGAFTVWDVKTGRPIREIQGLNHLHSLSVATIKLNPSGSKLLVANNRLGRAKSSEISIYDVRSGRKSNANKGVFLAADQDLSVIVSQGVAAESNDASIEFWHTEDDRKQKYMPFHASQKSRFPGRLFYTPLSAIGDRFVVANVDGKLKVVDHKRDGSFNVVKECRYESQLTDLQLRPKNDERDGQIITQHRDGSIRFCDANSLDEIFRIYCFTDGSWVAIRNDGKFTGSKNVGNRLTWIKNKQPAINGRKAMSQFITKEFATSN